MNVRYRLTTYLFVAALMMLTRDINLHASEQIDVASLTKAVKSCEARLANSSIEISTFQWEDGKEHTLLSSEMNRVIKWQDELYEASRFTDFKAKSPVQLLRFVWCDGETTTIYTPPELVEQSPEKYPCPAKFQPYSIILGALGYRGTLSQFLEGDQEPIVPLQVQITRTEEYLGHKTLVVRATRQLPGSQFIREIELGLATEHGYVPCWGRYSEIEGDLKRLKNDSRVTSFEGFDRSETFMQEIRSTAFKEVSGQVLQDTTVTRLNGQLIKDKPSNSFFAPAEFVDNPTIKSYKNGQLLSEKPYHPPVVKKPPPTPPFITWLAINAAVLCVIVLWCALLALLNFTTGRQLVRSMP